MNRKILILGAGRSASALILYLVRHASAQQWQITVADRDMDMARRLLQDAGDAAVPMALDATNAEARAHAIATHDLVISMLPAFMHMDVLSDCLRLHKHVITPSYVPDALWPMHEAFRDAGLIVLNEMGLDPGIDHMSAMRILDGLRDRGGEVLAFESYCGGLVAPESDDNPWGYKFSWNPRNVVLAGQGGTAKYIKDGAVRYLPYHRLFAEATRVEVPGLGAFDGYANRDSLKYRKAYGLDGIPTLLRGTLRRAGFCKAWDALVRLGCTEDAYAMELPAAAPWKRYMGSFLSGTPDGDLRAQACAALGLAADDDAFTKLDWLGLFGDAPIGVEGLSPAATLQHLLTEKWKLGPDDKDMVVMWHRFQYALEGRSHELQASMAVIGQDSTHTAMARTVGLPIAIACKLVLNGGIADRGVLLPLKAEVRDPILDELETLGIGFREDHQLL